MRKLLNVFLSVVMVCTVFIAMPAPKASAYSIGDDYPTKWKNIPMDSVFDDWGMYNRECTSFVAWCLSSRNGYAFNRAGKSWNANLWGGNARSMGFTVDMNPQVGSVAWWDAGFHVAWVRTVSGDSVLIEEYNYGYNGTYNERWINKNSVSGYIHFKDLNDAPTTPERIYPTDSANIPNGTYAIKGRGSGKFITMGNQMWDGVITKIYSDDNGILADDQKLIFTRQSDNSYTIQSTYSEKYLDIVLGSMDEGAYAHQWYGLYPSEHWYVLENIDGYYKFVNKDSGLVLDVEGGGTAEGTKLRQWSDNGTAAQQFQLLILHTITYNTNGGTGAPANQTKPHGTNLTLSGTVPTRSGYTFLGWSASSSATSATYAAGANYTADSDVILYAIWEAIPVTIKRILSAAYNFNENGHTVGGIYSGTSISSFLSNLSSGAYLKFYKNGNEITAGYIGTGTTIAIVENGTVLQSLTAVVTGDIDGDGQISATDLIAMKRGLLGVDTLTDAQKSAGCLGSNSLPDLTDLVMLKKHLAGQIPIAAK